MTNMAGQYSKKGPKTPGSGDGKYPTVMPLYHQRPFADNYTDPNFLAELQLNPCPHHWDLIDVISRSSRLAFQFSMVVLFYLIYYQLGINKIQPGTVIETCWTSSVLGHIIFQVYTFWPISFGFESIRILFPKEHMKVAIVFLVSSYQFAPILRTLTATISTDTIHACSVILFGLHLLTGDYGVPGFFVSKTMSMNTAVIASISLASRLPTDNHSLALITLSVMSFILFPMFSYILWDTPTSLAGMVLLISCGCSTVSVNYFLTYIIAILFITGVTPVLFVASQKYKYNVYGPWDEAVPNLGPMPQKPTKEKS